MTGTPTSRYEVANLDQWGRLIKTWATGLDYVTQAEAPQPPRTNWVNTTWPTEVGRTPAPKTMYDKDAAGNPNPWTLPSVGGVDVKNEDGGTVRLARAVAMTVKQFRTRVTTASVSITNIPDHYKNVIIVQGDLDTMVMRLPPKDTLQGSEDDLLNGTSYTLQPFYWALFGDAPNMPTDQAGIMDLHANRIGEYTLNNCM